jgi:hypothetical protein
MGTMNKVNKAVLCKDDIKLNHIKAGDTFESF